MHACRGFYIYTIITVALYTNVTLIMRLTDVAGFSWISYIFTTLSYVACQVGLKHSYTVSRWTRNYLAAPALCFQGTRALLGGSRARSFFPEADQGTRDRRPGRAHARRPARRPWSPDRRRPLPDFLPQIDAATGPQSTPPPPRYVPFLLPFVAPIY
jgi:hypothetical protein